MRNSIFQYPIQRSGVLKRDTMHGGGLLNNYVFRQFTLDSTDEHSLKLIAK